MDRKACSVENCQDEARKDSPRCSEHEIEYLKGKVRFWNEAWHEIRIKLGEAIWWKAGQIGVTDNVHPGRK